MAEIFSVTVNEIIKQLGLEVLYAPDNIDELIVTDNDCNRPGLQLMGFYEYFNAERIQICGNMEFRTILRVPSWESGGFHFMLKITLARSQILR